MTKAGIQGLAAGRSDTYHLALDDLGPGLTAAVEIAKAHLLSCDASALAAIHLIIGDLEARRDGRVVSPTPTSGSAS